MACCNEYGRGQKHNFLTSMWVPVSNGDPLHQDSPGKIMQHFQRHLQAAEANCKNYPLASRSRLQEHFAGCIAGQSVVFADQRYADLTFMSNHREVLYILSMKRYLFSKPLNHTVKGS